MSDKGNHEKCPFCGYINDNENPKEPAKENFILQDKYIVGAKLSENSESICYIGYDIKNHSKVHIREFFPSEICVRAEDGISVVEKKSCDEKFETLKNDFLNYFRSLAKVRDIDAVVPVYDIFTSNGSAYVISETVDGITLLEFIKRNNQPLNWDTAKILFMPIISALSRLNRTGVLHLAINPASLIIGKNGKMYISNFSTPNLRQLGVFSYFEFNKGFTAPEQYIKNYELTPATDVYGLTASLFFSLVGFSPKDASERGTDDRLLIPVRILKNIPPHVVSALSNGLKVNIQRRTPNFETLRDELTETSAKYLKEQDTSVQKSDNKLEKKSRKKNLLWIIGTVIIFLLLFISIFIFFVNGNKSQKDELQQDNLLVQKTEDVQDNMVVPNLIGKNFDDLQKENGSDDYSVFLSEKVFDDKVEEGKIISQTPQPETSVKKGSNIIVTVSKGPKFKILPQIEGLTLSQAASALSKEGFIPVQETQYSDVIEQGKTIGYKRYSKGDKVEVGTQVIILVSKG